MRRLLALTAATALLAGASSGCAGSAAGRFDDSFGLRLVRGLAGPLLVEEGTIGERGEVKTVPLLFHSGSHRRGPLEAGLTVVPPLLSSIRSERIEIEGGEPQSSWQADLLWPLLHLEGETAGRLPPSEGDAGAAGQPLGVDGFAFSLFAVLSMKSGANHFSWHVLWPLGPGYESDRDGQWLRFLGGLRVKLSGPIDEFKRPPSAWFHDHRRRSRLISKAQRAVTRREELRERLRREHAEGGDGERDGDDESGATPDAPDDGSPPRRADGGAGLHRRGRAADPAEPAPDRGVDEDGRR